MQRVASSNLHEGSDTEQAFSDATGRANPCSDAACSVQSLGTTANGASGLTESGSDAWSWAVVQWRRADPRASRQARRRPYRPERRDELHVAAVLDAPLAPEQSRADWQADLEYVWRARTTALVEKLATRARVCRRAARGARGWLKVRLLRRAEWAENRARALSMSRADVLSTCGKRWRQTECGCGRRDQLVWCDQAQLCSRCRKWWWGKWRARITSSLERHVADARARWYARGKRGMRPGVYLLTLTGPHSGNIETDRVRLGDAWRKLTKAANAGRWWGAYALAWEVTCGPTKLAPDRGPHDVHVHMHVAVVSSWIPYEDLHRAWRAAMPGARVLDVKSPQLTKHARTEAESAARYLAKYVTKGVEPSEFTGRKAGELLVAFRGRRKVTTSRYFWHYDNRCQKCGCQHRAVGHPVSLQAIAPGAVLRSLSERTRYRDVDRFVFQVPLRRSDDAPLL